jgi:L-arabinose isomerase
MAVAKQRARVILVSTYFALLGQGMGSEFQAQRMAFRDRVRAQCESLAVISADLLVDSAAVADEAGALLVDLEVDAIVIAPTMATPPDWIMALIRKRPDLPVIVLAVRENDAIPDDYDTEQGTGYSLLVGVTMLGNALQREARQVSIVLGTEGQDDAWQRDLTAHLLAAAGAGVIRRSRLLVAGSPIGGYSDVEASPADLAKLGVEAFSIDADHLNHQLAHVTTEEKRSFREWVEANGSIDVDEATLDASVNLACALQSMAREASVSGGTVNCHGPLFRESDQVGITACLAVTALASEGRMFSCTGDIPVALVLILGKFLAGAALYCELYAIDRPDDWILVANGGEGDLSLSVPHTTRFLPEDHYMGRRGPGVATAFDVQTGPATLVSMTPLAGEVGGWRMIALEGAVIGSRHRGMEGPNGMFRPSGDSALACFQSWAEVGAPHHAALVPGHWAEVLQGVASNLGIDFVAVAGTH